MQLRRPTGREIAEGLASRNQPFTYPEVGATRGLGLSRPEEIEAGYDFDSREYPLGVGRDLFERAGQALLGWRHFDITWIEFYGGSKPATIDQSVATLSSIAGIWFLNPCRVVYTEHSQTPGDLVAFAYGTLPGHAEQGEERFEVSLDPEPEEVKYRIAAFSRPSALLVRLAYPFARRLQQRFAEASAHALARACG